jgi:hypothetical protein
MIDFKMYQKRVAQIYNHDRERWRKVLSKGMPKGVLLDIAPADVLPYTQAQFGQWLWTQIQLGAILCPFCGAPIDILNMELDHKTPLRRGGGMEFENRECICRRCNQVKGELCREEFILLVVFMQTDGAHFRTRLEGVLINGGVGRMMRHFPKAENKGKKPAKQEAIYFAELGEF